MSTLEILADEIKEYKKLQVISEMALVKEHIKLFENKYNCKFKEFENMATRGAESFEWWDDYIEWKAYQRNLEEVKKKIGEIENAQNIKVTN